MNEFQHGLIIGKFYPPHIGHHDLIRRAAAACAEVTVLTMASRNESLSLSERVEWLEREHQEDGKVALLGMRCDVPLDVTSEPIWRAHVSLMSAILRMHGRPPVDAVFSAEAYGDELAARLGAKHVRIPRSNDEPSSTAVRMHLAGAWQMLAPATRAGLTLRVVFVGAESTGTTTLSRALAAEYCSRGGIWARTQWVSEYGREYTAIKWARACDAARLSQHRPPALDELVWTHHDFDEVAAEQTRREDQAAGASSPLLVCDTDAFATSVWERRYLGTEARKAQAWTQSPTLPRHDVYFVTDHIDVPWDDDGLREGDLAIRAAMTQWFMDALTSAGHSWVLLGGSLEERLDLAVRTTDNLLNVRARFTDPMIGPGFER